MGVFFGSKWMALPEPLTSHFLGVSSTYIWVPNGGTKEWVWLAWVNLGKWHGHFLVFMFASHGDVLFFFSFEGICINITKIRWRQQFFQILSFWKEGGEELAYLPKPVHWFFCDCLKKKEQENKKPAQRCPLLINLLIGDFQTLSEFSSIYIRSWHYLGILVMLIWKSWSSYLFSF